MIAGMSLLLMLGVAMGQTPKDAEPGSAPVLKKQVEGKSTTAPPKVAKKKFVANTDEAKLPPYELPDPLMMQSGEAVADATAWRTKRRPELLKLFEQHVYGRTPRSASIAIGINVREDWTASKDGKALRKQLRINFANVAFGPGAGAPAAYIDVLLYVPKDAPKPVSVFMGLNFIGNHGVDHDPAIHLCESWLPNNDAKAVAGNRAIEGGRGKQATRWCVDQLIARGYGVATAYYGDIDPDFDDGFANGIHPMFHATGTKPAADEWGSIGAWSWGLSRMLDALEKEPRIDAKRVVVHGHSRLGKTSLWAGATDERFAGVIANNSGCGGAALSRRIFGETVGRINEAFPHWFCDNYNKYNENENACPVDQHELIALIAPRPVYVASATLDTWADPKGEFLSLVHAAPVYKLLGVEPFAAKEMPKPNAPLIGPMAYHLREGKHDITDFDWNAYMDWADRYVR